MNRSSFVSVAGEIARPGRTPLAGVPFGREWLFRGAPGTPSRKVCLAELKTSCIDVNAPHRMCRWGPAREPKVARQTASPTPSTPAQAAPARSAIKRPFVLRPSLGRVRAPNRGVIAAAWAIGAISIIGWLVAAHTPTSTSTRYASSQETMDSAAVVARNAMQPPTTAPGHATPATDLRTTPIQTANSPAPARRAIPADAATVASKPVPADIRRARPASPIVNRTAQATAPAPTAGTHRAAVRPPPVRRIAQAAPPSPADTPIGHPFDDPRTLIALAGTLRADLPDAVSPGSSRAAAEWPTRLTQHRLTDTPDAFIH